MDPKYFKQANFILASAIVTGMGLCHLGCFNPHVVPHEYMGPLGQLYKLVSITYPSLIRWIYYPAVLVHVTEAILTIPMTTSRGITDNVTRVKWFVQTLLLGIGSMSLLMSYKPKEQPKRH